MRAKAGIEGFKFGCDPECFVINSDGELVSAFGLIQGTKAEPFKVEHGAIQVDGMAAEFNIDPVDNFNDWDRNITAVMAQLRDRLPEGHKLLIKSAVNFPQSIIDAMPPEALELGCDPDFNAWDNGKENLAPVVPEGSNLRTASGHVHVGWTDGIDIMNPDHRQHCIDFVKQLDWYLGGPSIRFDDSKERRKLYGRAGAMRVKPYGVEYRVLSNFWLTSKERRMWVWNQMQEAIARMRLPLSYYPESRKHQNDRLIAAINETKKSEVVTSGNWNGFIPAQYMR